MHSHRKLSLAVVDTMTWFKVLSFFSMIVAAASLDKRISLKFSNKIINVRSKNVEDLGDGRVVNLDICLGAMCPEGPFSEEG
jgi:hypothetical protein